MENGAPRSAAPTPPDAVGAHDVSRDALIENGIALIQDQQSAYEQIVRMNPLDNYLGRQCTADLDLFLVNEDNAVLRVEEDGTLTAMMD